MDDAVRFANWAIKWTISADSQLSVGWTQLVDYFGTQSKQKSFELGCNSIALFDEIKPTVVVWRLCRSLRRVGSGIITKIENKLLITWSSSSLADVVVWDMRAWTSGWYMKWSGVRLCQVRFLCPFHTYWIRLVVSMLRRFRLMFFVEIWILVQ